MRMNRKAKASLGLLALLLAISSGLALIPASQDCDSRIVATLPSPDNRLVARQEQTTCRAKAETMTKLWLIEPGDNQQFNLFEARSAQSVSDPDPFPPFDLEVRWINESELFISFPAGHRIVWMPQSVRGIRIHHNEQALRP
jgi:hypothetical protein